MLTDRAKNYLKTLDRKSFVATSHVEKLLVDNGYPCVKDWLDFHEDYAGYVEVIGKDKAIWGLVHENAEWLEPYSVDVEYDKKEGHFDIVCADVHPSYSYLLRDNGEFFGFSSESFDVYIERKAVGYEFSLYGNVYSIDNRPDKSDFYREALDKRNLIVEASDNFFNYYCSGNFLLLEDLDDLSISGWYKK